MVNNENKIVCSVNKIPNNEYKMLNNKNKIK